jgi:hypothetical protein
MRPDGWGTFEGRDGNVHVAPCTEDGGVAGVHFLSVQCPCGPTIEKRIGSRPLVVHDEPDVDPVPETRH